MGVQLIISGDNFASIKGDMEDFLDGGFLDVQGADVVPDPDTPELPAPAKQRRGRKPKAAAPGDTVAKQDAQAAHLPAATAATSPAAAAPQAVLQPTIHAGSPTASAAAAPLGPEAVTPGGVVFNAVKAYNDKFGMEKARDLLLTFGAGMVRQIKPADYERAIAAFAIPADATA